MNLSEVPPSGYPDAFLYRIGDVLSYGLTGSNPDWIYDHALIQGIEWSEGMNEWRYLVGSCSREGIISPVSLGTAMSRPAVENGWGKLARPAR